jgi:hypothetical protein
MPLLRILPLCQEKGIVILNYNISCFGRLYCFMHFESIFYFHVVRNYIRWFFGPMFILIDVN